MNKTTDLVLMCSCMSSCLPLCCVVFPPLRDSHPYFAVLCWPSSVLAHDQHNKKKAQTWLSLAEALNAGGSGWLSVCCCLNNRSGAQNQYSQSSSRDSLQIFVEVIDDFLYLKLRCGTFVSPFWQWEKLRKHSRCVLMMRLYSLSLFDLNLSSEHQVYFK